MAKKKAKKAKKRSARRKAARGGRRSGGTLSSIPTSQLQAELERRSNDLDKLEARREELMAQVEEVDAEISTISAALGAGRSTGARGRRPGRRPGRRGRPAGAKRAKSAGSPGPGRKRHQNTESLEQALAKVLKGKTMGVTEAADAVQKAGYKTTSPNFRTIVNQALLRSDLIRKTGRGAYTAA